MRSTTHMRYLFLVVLVLCSGIPSTGLPSDSSPTTLDTQATDGPVTTPQEMVAKMKVPSGFRVGLFASEPMVRQPISITTDERGRIWVAENYTYAEAKVNFNLNFRDRIVVLEDTDGDGSADRQKVFWDQGQHLTAVMVGFGGVWALCAPNLIFIPDRNRDDVPDSEPIVVLDGWNNSGVRHNIVNGLTLGPDGWIYGRHGILATSFVGRPGAPQSQRVPINTGVWRYHPTREVFEAVAHGTTNPWGFDFDDYGEMFFINTVIGHLWHIVPGAHYRRMYGVDLRSNLYQLIEQTADHFHWDTVEAWHDVRKGLSDRTSALGGGHAHCGLMIYLGDNFPREYRGNVFTVNLHGLRLNRDTLERNRSTYVAKHAPDFLTTNDPWFRGVELIYGADGAVYIADWSDIGECHENDGVHRSSGRIYRVWYGEPKPAKPLDLASLSNAELVQRQRSSNDWHVRTARRILQERAASEQSMQDVKGSLVSIFTSDSDVTRRLRALWGLVAIGAATDSWLLEQLADREEHVRAWAVRLLADGPEVEHKIAIQLARHQDKSALVRLYQASSLQKMTLEDRWGMAMRLASSSIDASDPMIPLLIWYGIEPAVTSSPGRALELAKSTQIGTLRTFVARRIASSLDEDRASFNQLVALAAETNEAKTRSEILQGIGDALKGWGRADRPPAWDQLIRRIPQDDPGLPLVRDLSVLFGDGRALDELRGILGSNTQPAEVRRSALRVLVESRVPDLFPVLQKLANDREIVNSVIEALAACEQPEVGEIVLAQYGRLDAAGREAAINTLTSRAVLARKLLAAVSSGTIDRREITAYHARQIQSFNDATLVQELARVWGEIRESKQDKRELALKLKEQLTSTALQEADRSNGRLLFAKNCANCHKLFGSGVSIGPDLTGSNRQNLDYLLENVVDPSATVAADFRVSIVTMNDGRVITGVVVEKTKRTVIVQAQKERMILPAAEVAEVVPQNVSLMPEGLLTPMSAKEIRDLFAYVSGRTQATLPAE